MINDTEFFNGFDEDGNNISNVSKVSKELRDFFLENGYDVKVGDYIHASALSEELKSFSTLDEAFEFARINNGVTRFSSPLVFEGVEED